MGAASAILCSGWSFYVGAKDVVKIVVEALFILMLNRA
jgi:hypothetical protein